MSPWVSVPLLVVLLALVLVAMRAGWRRRVAATADAAAGLPAVPAPDALGEPRTEAFEGTYVSTTRSGDWLDRVSAGGLGVRAAATVQVHDAGVVVARQGAPDLFLPAADLVSATGTGGMAGKFVGGEGLTVLTWRTRPDEPGDRGDPGEDRGLDAGPDTRLDTGLRLRHPADRAALVAAVGQLIETSSASRGEQRPAVTGPAQEE